MSTTKSSARTKSSAKSKRRPSERSVTDPTRAISRPNPTASGRSSNGSHPTNLSTNPISTTSGGSSNGAQPTIAVSESRTSTSAAPTFNVRASLREFLSEHPELTTRDEIVSAYIAKLTRSQARDVLYATLRQYAYNLIGESRRHDWKGAETQAAERQGSAKWDEVQEAVRDGSLDKYRVIVDVEFMLNEQRVRFGSMSLDQVEALIDIRQRQERAFRRQRERLLRIHDKMRATGAATVEDLDPVWLMDEWIHA